EVDRLTLNLGGIRDQPVRGATVQLEMPFDQTVQLALLGLRRLAVQRNHMDQQRGRRQPVVAVAEGAVLGLGGNNVGDELTQAVEHKVLPKSMMPRGKR